MSLFKNGLDAENLLCLRLRALTEEFGPENITVSVPQSWREYSETGYIGRVRLSFADICAIKVEAFYEGKLATRWEEALLPA